MSLLLWLLMLILLVLILKMLHYGVHAAVAADAGAHDADVVPVFLLLLLP
jgi:hypothetical protein